MKTFIIHAAALMAISSASAEGFAQESDKAALALPTLQFIGSGCAADQSGTDYHWEGSTLVVNFSQMVAQRGAGISLTQSRKTCSLTINLKMPKGLSYSLAGYKAAGFDDLSAGASRTLTVTNFFQGQSQTTTLSDAAVGPNATDFDITHYNSSSENLWSPCNAERAQTVTVAVRVSGTGSDDTVSTLDSLRLPIRIKLCSKVFN